MEDVATLLMELRRQAQLQGRPISQQEMQGVISEGINAQARLESLGKELQMARDANNKQYKMAKKQMSKDQLWNWINGIGNAGMTYAYGKAAKLW